MNAAQTREIISEMLFICDFGLIILVLKGAIDHRIHDKRDIALVLLVFGTLIIRGWYSVGYLVERFGVDSAEIADGTFSFALIGLLIALLGIGFYIKLYSPPSWGYMGCILVFSVAVFYVGWMQTVQAL